MNQSVTAISQAVGEQAPPTVVGAFERAASPAQAEEYTRKLAHSHYENFSVVTFLLPPHLRQDFCNVYAFCRTADDLGDETADTGTALRFLEEFKEQTRQCYAGRASTPVFVALAGTIRRHDIPIQPFLHLIDAFEQDQRVRRYETFDEVLDYCRRSANPVGRLVLYMCGYRDERRQGLSDHTCTALQLANFWQDVRRDFLDLDRIYLPRESMRQFGVSEDELTRQIREGACTQAARDLIRFEVDRAEKLFDQGDALLPLLDGAVRPQIRLFGRGGRAILGAIRRQNHDTLSRRPSLSKWQKGRLMLSSLPGVLWSKLRSGRGQGRGAA